MQVDGEPCRLAPAMIRISLRNQANMVQKSKRRTSMPLLNEWVCPCPPWWTRRPPWRGGHRACAWSGASLCWERRVQETQQFLGPPHSFLLHLYRWPCASFRNDCCVLDWWCLFTDRLSIYLLGPADHHYEWLRAIKRVQWNVFFFVLRRLVVGLLFTPLTWRVLVSPSTGGWQSWVLAHLSPRCLLFSS